MNPADILTKALPSGENRRRKIRLIMYDLYPENANDDDCLKLMQLYD